MWRQDPETWPAGRPQVAELCCDSSTSCSRVPAAPSPVKHRKTHYPQLQWTPPIHPLLQIFKTIRPEEGERLKMKDNK